MKVLLSFSRILVGLLFIFSGLIKANDPIGFAYKLEEYFIVFGMDWFIPLSVFLSIFICILEIIFGVAVLIGTKMQFFSLLLLLMIIFFTWLTGYSAITGAVTDCGCFGDAIKLKPASSFIKDLILLFFIGVIYVKRKEIKPFSSGNLPYIILGTSSILITYFTIMNYLHLPVKDFRPFKVGNYLPELMVCPEGSPETIYQVFYTLENQETGETKKMTDKEYLETNIWKDQTWKINKEKTENKLISEGCEPPIHDFTIDSDGVDITEDILKDENYSLWVIAYDLEKTNISAFTSINILANKLETENMNVFALTSTADVESFRHNIGTPFPFYNTDITALKTIIRANPGILLVKKGTVIAKYHYRDLPDFEELSQTFFKK